MTDQPLPRSGKDRSHAPPAFQFYPADFMGGRVAEMSLEERGAYITLLCHAWQVGSIPADPKALGRILCGIQPQDVQRIMESMESCWEAQFGNRLVNPRLERERALQGAYRDRAAASSSAGGAARAASAKRASNGRFQAHPPATPGSAGPAETPAGNQPHPAPYSESESEEDFPANAGSSGAPKQALLPVSKPRSRRRPPSGPHADFIAWWEAEYQDVLGTPYARSWSVEGPLLSGLLKQFPPDELKARARRWLRTTDAWISKTDRSLRIFASKVNTPCLLRDGVTGNENFDTNMDVLRRAIQRGRGAVNGKP